MRPYNHNIRFFSSLFVFSLALLLFQSCGDGTTGPSYENAPPPYVDIYNTEPDSTTEDSLRFYFIEEGSGPFEVIPNDEIQVHYTGRTAGNGEIFESTYVNGFESPRTFRNLTPEVKTTPNGQVGNLIDGFRRGLLGMKIGEKRTLVIPPELGYGTSEEEENKSTLRDKTLVFDVELLQISR